MKQRLLVMNGQRLLQNEIEGEWVVFKVGRAGSLRPGIYNIYSAERASKTNKNVGTIVHRDQMFLYQKIDGGLVKHSLDSLQSIPEIGRSVEIYYLDGKASIEYSSEAIRINRNKR